MVAVVAMIAMIAGAYITRKNVELILKRILQCLGG